MKSYINKTETQIVKMKMCIIEKDRKISYSIKILLDVMGLNSLVKENERIELEKFKKENINFLIMNASHIDNDNKNDLAKFAKDGGKIIFYGMPNNNLLKELFDIGIVNKEKTDAYGYIEKNFIDYLEENKYYNERKIPFCFEASLDWKNSTKFGKLLHNSDELAIAYIGKSGSSNNVAYLLPDVFGAAYSLLTDQNDSYREGIFKRQFPIDSLLYVYIKIILAVIENLSRDITILKYFWPNKNLSALTLTHDIDTLYDITDGINAYRTLEKKFGVISAWNFRPGDRYEIPKELINGLMSDGNEIGLHSINESIKSLPEFKRQKKFIENYTDQEILGVRSHALNREPIITQEIAHEAGMLYDSSIPDTDNCVPNQQFKGNTIFFPYQLYFTKSSPAKNLLILPLTIHDWWYVTGNKWEENKIMQFYKDKTAYIRDRNGLNVVLFHAADYMSGKDRLWMYEQYLDYIKKLPRLWLAKPKEIALWARYRDNLEIEYTFDNNDLKIQVRDKIELPEGEFIDTISLLIRCNQDLNKLSVYYNQSAMDFELEKIKKNKTLLHIRINRKQID